MIYLDSETCGFHGPMVLLQYARDNGAIEVYDVWLNKVSDTLSLIEDIADDTVIMYNSAFDWFHICQTYTTLRLCHQGDKPNIDEYKVMEAKARFGPCLRPKSTFDVWLHARKGPYQSTMDRSDIKVKRIPTDIANLVQEELNKRIVLPNIYFERKEDKSIRWQVTDIITEDGSVNPEFKDLVLRFSPSSGLKALAHDALGITEDLIYKFVEVEPNPVWRPEEVGFAPFYPHSNWPDVIQHHIDHWAYNEHARTYASNDVKYTRDLYKFFGSPEVDDDDSVLACMVGAVRWRGFDVDVEALKGIKAEKRIFIDGIAKKYNANFNSPDVCRKFLCQVLAPIEQAVLVKNEKLSTGSIILEEICKWKEAIVCPKCDGLGCPDCEDGLVSSDKPHPAAERASVILEHRHATKEVELYDKIILAGRFHADFKVIGTKSSRMSGASGLNAQGINRNKKVRACFGLADEGMTLCGGDFSGFEVCLADAVYKDPKLHEALVTGKKIHALFGQYLFPGYSYEDIIASAGTKEDKYIRSKNGVFAMLYGGEAHTLATRVGVDPKVAEEAYQKWISEYRVWGQARLRVNKMFCTMVQSGGIGSKITWSEPADYMESMFGFKRYFTLENKIAKVLFELASDPPKTWGMISTQVMRRDRIQTASGAARSAIYAAAFAIQAANMRAAANHEIQSSGAQLCKKLQRRIWDLQPEGLAAWRVQPLNIHDEIMCPAIGIAVPKIREIVEAFVSEYRAFVPLLDIEWHDKMDNWASK